MDQQILTFNGHDYHVNRVTARAADGPRVEFKIDDLDLIGAHPVQVRLFGLAPDSSKNFVYEGVPVFYKFEGKYVVLLGSEVVRQKIEAGQQVIAGRLISGPSLKRARVETASRTESSPGFDIGSNVRFKPEQRSNRGGYNRNRY